MTNAKIRKTYKYATDYTKDNTSSGVVPFEPEYAYHFIMGGHDDGGMGDDLETVYGTSSYGLPTTATGTADILYSRVFETDEHNNDKIITQYDFSTYIDCPDHLDMAFSNCGSTNNRIYTSYAHKEVIWSARLYSTQSATISRSDTTINTRFWKATAEISREIS
ncbi:MAG: hypothetical protein L6U61_06360 [Bacteroidales bacterium]|nr:MAG: hypothetical protein L6U61_06360 [Bacteroidales bacterium]